MTEVSGDWVRVPYGQEGVDDGSKWGLGTSTDVRLHEWRKGGLEQESVESTGAYEGD